LHNWGKESATDHTRSTPYCQGKGKGGGSESSNRLLRVQTAGRFDTPLKKRQRKGKPLKGKGGVALASQKKKQQQRGRKRVCGRRKLAQGGGNLGDVSAQLVLRAREKGGQEKRGRSDKRIKWQKWRLPKKNNGRLKKRPSRPCRVGGSFLQGRKERGNKGRCYRWDPSLQKSPGGEKGR